MNQSLIRNFCVVSHIDHGKTTLTDRFLELTKTVESKNLTERYLDSNPIEQERGITIKLAPVRMHWQNYVLNLIDTPGHVDFAYEVSRSLAACEGAVLLVDATQGIQAQTLANAYKAINQGLVLIPVINKIDMVDRQQIIAVTEELKSSFGFKDKEILTISAKVGTNLIQLIEAIIERVPPPVETKNQSLQALVFNSYYHVHLGVIVSVRLFNGQVSRGDTVQFISNHANFKAETVGYFVPQLQSASGLTTGEVGYIATGLKDINLCRVGDTLTGITGPAQPLAGYQQIKPMVFMDLYPVENGDFLRLKQALEKLTLNDSSLEYVPVNSSVLGSGYKVGFQGLLHADVVQERLEREFDLDLISTSPSVAYEIEMKNGALIMIKSAAELPESSLINQIREPMIELSVFTPRLYLGPVMQLVREKQGELINQEFFGPQVQLLYKLPLRELVSNFFSQLKSCSSGFASLDWNFAGLAPVDLVKLEVLLNREPIAPLAVLEVKSQAEATAKIISHKLKAVIPRQQFELPIQIALGGKILARETIKAFRKDVTVKLHAADLSRKSKLLQKQKKGKKRLKAIGKLHLPQEAFLALMRSD